MQRKNLPNVINIEALDMPGIHPLNKHTSIPKESLLQNWIWTATPVHPVEVINKGGICLRTNEHFYIKLFFQFFCNGNWWHSFFYTPGLYCSSCTSFVHHFYPYLKKNAIFPTLWKKAYVSPIFKNGRQNDISNYRGISLLCNFAKNFETTL